MKRFKSFTAYLLLVFTIFSLIGNPYTSTAALAVSSEASDDIIIDTPSKYEIKSPGLLMEAVDEDPDATARLAALPREDASKIKRSSRSSSTDTTFESSVTKYFNNTMNKQLVNYLSDGAGEKAEVKTINEGYYKSLITFTFDNSKLSGINISDTLYYIAECISINPNLCILSTRILRQTLSAKTRVSIYSTIESSDIYSSIRKYKEFLAEIEEYVINESKMTDTDILLALHDRLVTSVEYATDLTDPRNHPPVWATLRGIIVCQAYAVVYNHLMRDLGFSCIYLTSSDHAWNAVRISGKWYYTDTTWDDPSNYPEDRVSHEYFLVPHSSFEHSHDQSAFCSARYAGLDSYIGNDYTDYYPKKKRITYPMYYSDGRWYFASSGHVYSWDGKSSSSDIINAIPSNKYRRGVLLDNIYYYSGSDGVYKISADDLSLLISSSDTGLISKYNPTAVSQMYLKKGTIYLNTSSGWMVIRGSSEHKSYEELNGTSGIERVTLKKPSKPVYTVKSPSKKKAKITVTSSKNATGGYTVQIATDSSFSSGKKTYTTTSRSFSISSLTSNKTYYVRVRGIYKNGSYKKYGSFGATKKIKIK